MCIGNNRTSPNGACVAGAVVSLVRLTVLVRRAEQSCESRVAGVANYN
jgi:hypothetical protein